MSNSYKFYSDTKDIMKKYVNATEGAIIYGISKSRIMVLAYGTYVVVESKTPHNMKTIKPYYLVETKTIDGFVLDDTPIEADLSYPCFMRMSFMSWQRV